MAQSGLAHFLRAALQNLLQIVQVALRRVGQDGKRRDGAAAHGIDVAQCVGGGDGAVSERIVYDRREEIHGLHKGKLRRQLVDAGIVGGVEAHQHVIVRYARNAR